jgi:putative ABC transport system permease protein
MKFSIQLNHLLRSSLADFQRNKVRTFLTSLGITIGVFSVVVLIALGLGLRNFVQQQFESLGANLVIVLPGSGIGGGGRGALGAGLLEGAQFDERDLATVGRIRDVDYITPFYLKNISIESDKKTEFGYIIGATEDLFVLVNAKPLEGQLFTRTDVSARNKVAVLGYVLAENLFDDPALAIGKQIRMGQQRYRVIGVIERVSDPDRDNAAFVPFPTTFGSLNPNKTYFAIYMGVRSDELVPQVKENVEAALLRRYDDDDFTVSEQGEFLDTFNQIFLVINAILLAIGSISLIVGGIGIMNIMYATVTERTKEIGIRRAIGATKKDILFQFMTEAVILAVLGGALGLGLAGILVFVIRFFFPAAINLLTVIVAFGVSSLIGIVFGVFPARRAANLSPIEAIRYE